MNRIKKHRGLRRYYKNLELKNEDWSELKFTDSNDAWFDRWHKHFDWYGYEKRYGNADEAFCVLYKKGIGITVA